MLLYTGSSGVYPGIRDEHVPSRQPGPCCLQAGLGTTGGTHLYRGGRGGGGVSF